MQTKLVSIFSSKEQEEEFFNTAQEAMMSLHVNDKE